MLNAHYATYTNYYGGTTAPDSLTVGTTYSVICLSGYMWANNFSGEPRTILCQNTSKWSDLERCLRMNINFSAFVFLWQSCSVYCFTVVVNRNIQVCNFNLLYIAIQQKFSMNPCFKK